MQELQVVAEIISGLSGDASTAFIVYLVYQLLKTVLGLLVVSGAIYALYHLIRLGMYKTQFMCNMADLIGCYSLENREDRERILQLIKMGKNSISK
jgi:hypothetical protein